MITHTMINAGLRTGWPESMFQYRQLSTGSVLACEEVARSAAQSAMIRSCMR